MTGRGSYHAERSRGRVRHVGPPFPLREISSPSYSSTEHPKASRRRRERGPPASITTPRGTHGRTLQARAGDPPPPTSTSPGPPPPTNSHRGTRRSPAASQAPS